MGEVLRPCLHPRCPRLVKSGCCEEHQQARDAKHNASNDRWVYRDARWQACRRVALERAGFRCEELDEHGVRCSYAPPRGSGLHGDHVPALRHLLASGRSPFDPKYVVIRCESCHGRKHALEQAAVRRLSGV